MWKRYLLVPVIKNTLKFLIHAVSTTLVVYWLACLSEVQSSFVHVFYQN